LKKETVPISRDRQSFFLRLGGNKLVFFDLLLDPTDSIARPQLHLAECFCHLEQIVEDMDADDPCFFEILHRSLLAINQDTVVNLVDRVSILPEALVRPSLVLPSVATLSMATYRNSVG
jgi:hypothetical protein